MHLVAIHTVQYNDTKGVQHVAEPGSMFEFFGDTDRLITLGAARAASVDELVLAGFQDEQPSLDLHPLVIQSPVVPLALDPAMQTPAAPVAQDPMIQTPAVNLVAEDTVVEPAAEVVPARRRRRAVAEAPVAETAVETVEVPAESEPAGDVASETTETSEPTSEDASEGDDDLL